MLFQLQSSRICRHLARVSKDRAGRSGIIVALLIPLLAMAAGGVFDVFQAMGQKGRHQKHLDAAMLAAVRETAAEAQFETAAASLRDSAGIEISPAGLSPAAMSLSLAGNADGSLTGTLQMPHPTTFLKMIHIDTIPISLSSTAIKTGDDAGDVRLLD